ncbi:MAG: hypothetical protein ACD_13C00140G0004 [uncultured bacterium]|nr:MAG: hypothetical protein ACD_13C00140G0004 [uncultured bacterium]KKR53148.1 MAG: hypothetical protein UT88_C0013G0001 [Candidatus Woesebacteria bacterium GW2011_GWD2_40_19]
MCPKRMANVELQSRSQVNYELVGKKLLSGEAMNDVEKNSVFGIATEFASNLVDNKADSLQGILQQSQDVRDHMNVIVLDRLVSLYQSGSTVMFENLKKTVCDSLSIKENRLSDERLYAFLSSSLDNYFGNEISSEVKKGMDFIRETVERIVPTKI